MSTNASKSRHPGKPIVKLRTREGKEIQAYLHNWQRRPNGTIAVVLAVETLVPYKAWLSDDRIREGFVEHPGCKVEDDSNIDQHTLELKPQYETTSSTGDPDGP